jgi:hypothetical protein
MQKGVEKIALTHKQKWVAESRIFSADEAAGSMPRDTAGLELWVVGGGSNQRKSTPIAHII